MQIIRAIFLWCVLVGTAACSEANKQHGVTGVVLDKLMVAHSKRMDLLRAEIAMMFLSYVAVDSGERTEADNIASIAALNRTALAIDCMRSADAPDALERRLKEEKADCGAPMSFYFFDTRMVSIDRNLLTLARSSLPTASLANLLSALPNGSTQPLSLISPILGVARDAVSIGLRGMAVYRDAVEIEVAVYCAAHAASNEFCSGLVIANGRDVEKQRLFVTNVLAKADSRFSMSPGPEHFSAARSQTAANCQRLQSKTGISGTVPCRVMVDV